MSTKMEWMPIIVGLIIAMGGSVMGLFKRKKKAEKPKVIARCPHCGSENGLQQVRNYLCHECKKSVLFFKDTKNTKPLDNIDYQTCPNCNHKEFSGILCCTNCSMTLPKS